QSEYDLDMHDEGRRLRRHGRQPGDHPAVAALFASTRRRLLRWLFLNPEETFYIRQLARMVGGTTGDVPRGLDRLEAAGIVRRRKEGRRVFFQANRESPVFAGLRSIFRETGIAPHARSR